MMQIVIDMPDSTTKEMLENYESGSMFDEVLRGALKQAIILSKGHGRLGDLDALEEEISSWGMNDYEPLDFIDAIDDAPTIIEADNEVEE